MSGKRVAPTGDITLRTAPASAGNAIFEVFGTPAGNNLVGLVGSNVDPGTRPPPYTVASTIPTAASGNLKFSFFAGKSVFLAVPTTLNVAAISTTTLTPTLSGGGGTSYQIAVGTSAGTSNTVGWRSATTGTQITALSFVQGTSYYISAYSSNATNETASLATSNTAAYGIPNVPTSPSITLTSLTNWSLGWTAPAGIAPATYSYILSNTTDSTVFTSGSTASTSVSGSTALTQAKNYAVYVSSVRPEASSANANSTSSSLAAPGDPTTYTVSSINTANYTPNVSGGTGSYYVILGTVSGGSTPVNSWSTGTVSQVSAVGTSYYLTAITSNTTTGTKSAQFTSAAVGIPNPATGVTLTISGLSSWSFSWTAPASGIAPTGYSWYLNTVNNSITSPFASGSGAGTSTGAQTSTLATNTTYYGLVVATRPEASSTLAASAGITSPAPPAAPTNFTITAMAKTTVSFSWTAVSGATSYTLSYTGGTVTGLTGTTYTFTISGLADGAYTCTLAAVNATGTGASSGAMYFGMFVTPTVSTSFSAPATRTYTVTVVGAGGATSYTSFGSGYTLTAGGAGATLISSASLPAASYVVKVGGKGLSYNGVPGGAIAGGTNGGGGAAGQASFRAIYPGSGGGYSEFGTRGAALSLTAGGGGGAGAICIAATYNERGAVAVGGDAGMKPAYTGSTAPTASIAGYVCCGAHGPFTATGGGGATQSVVGAGGTFTYTNGYEAPPQTEGPTSASGNGASQTGGQGSGINYYGARSAAGGGGGGGYFGGGAGGWMHNEVGADTAAAGAGGGGGSSFKGSSFATDSAGATLSATDTDGYVLVYG